MSSAPTFALYSLIGRLFPSETRQQFQLCHELSGCHTIEPQVENFLLQVCSVRDSDSAHLDSFALIIE